MRSVQMVRFSAPPAQACAPLDEDIKDGTAQSLGNLSTSCWKSVLMNCGPRVGPGAVSKYVNV